MIDMCKDRAGEGAFLMGYGLEKNGHRQRSMSLELLGEGGMRHSPSGRKSDLLA